MGFIGTGDSGLDIDVAHASHQCKMFFNSGLGT
jgi:hypothetical protein